MPSGGFRPLLIPQAIALAGDRDHRGVVQDKLIVTRNPRGKHGRATSADALELIRELSKVCDEFGKWHTVWDLFDKWNDVGLLDEILRRLRAAKVDVGDIDQDLWCIDGSVVRAARCTAGGAKKGTRRSLLTTR